MSEHLDHTIASLRVKIDEFEVAAGKIKATINQLLHFEGRPPMYAEADLQASSRALSVPPDAFFTKPLASCVRQILEARQEMNQGAATLDELYAALLAGGYDFQVPNEGRAKQNLAISLGKNMAFLRLPSGVYGIRSWYDVKAGKRNKAEENQEPTSVYEEMADDELKEQET